MKKLIKISISTGFFILGIIVAFQASDFFWEQIIDLYKWSSNGNIHFRGKFIGFWSFNPIYLLSFGFSFLLFSLKVTSQTIYKTFKNLFLQLFIFALMVVCISSFDAMSRIATCTACDDGILVLHFGKVKYALILSSSVLCSSIPTLLRMIGNKCKSYSLK